MRWQCWRILAHAHSAMAERREEAVVAVVDAGGCCAGGGGVSFSFVIFFSAGGAGRDMGRSVGDRRQGLCVSRPCSDSRGRRMVYSTRFTA